MCIAFGWNKHIAFTMNFLHTAKGDYDGIARNFIARYLMEADSLEDAWTRIVTTPHCVGHNYQVMDFATGETVDIEVAPFDRIGRFRPLPDMPHFHSNMYSLIMVDDTPSASSIHREARYKELQPPHSFKEAMAILGDEYVCDQLTLFVGKTRSNPSIAIPLSTRQLLISTKDVLRFTREILRSLTSLPNTYSNFITLFF